MKIAKIILHCTLNEDYPSNTKHGVVCAYYKNSLPFKVINAKYLLESISYEVRVRDKCIFLSLEVSLREK